MTTAQIITPSTAIMAAPDPASGRETDALYGESVTIIADHKDWVEIRLNTDGYHGFIRRNALGALPEASHHIISPRALLTESPDIKSPAAGYIPLGGLIHATPAAQVDNVPADNTLAVHNQDGIIGYMPAHHAMAIGDYCPDYVAVAESLIGTPYRWGGRDSIGIDCSALVQLSLAASGVPVMRNSGDQEHSIGQTIEARDDLRRGDLIFWRGHVGIMSGANTLLHANMHHSMTAQEDFDRAMPRLERAAGPITRMARP